MVFELSKRTDEAEAEACAAAPTDTTAGQPKAPRPKKVHFVAFNPTLGFWAKPRGFSDQMYYIDTNGLIVLDAMVDHVEKSWDEMNQPQPTVDVGPSWQAAREAFAARKFENLAGITQSMLRRFNRVEIEPDGQSVELSYFDTKLASTDAKGSLVPFLNIKRKGRSSMKGFGPYERSETYDANRIITAWRVVDAFGSLLGTAHDCFSARFGGMRGFVGYRFASAESDPEKVTQVPPNKAEVIEEALAIHKAAKRLPLSVPNGVLSQRLDITNYFAPTPQRPRKKRSGA